MVITLKTETRILELDVNNDDWCYINLLLDSNNKIKIGADSYPIIKNKLFTMINNFDLLEKAGKINEKDIYFVISLYEFHHSIYANKDGNGINIFIENDKGQIIDTFLISNKYIDEWVEILNKV